MAQIQTLQKMLNDMESQINQLNEHISNKEQLIEHTILRINELNTKLVTEKEELDVALNKREKMLEMQSEVQINYKQINESVDTLVEILKTKV
jgi:hypothetical protein